MDFEDVDGSESENGGEEVEDVSEDSSDEKFEDALESLSVKESPKIIAVSA